MNGIEVDGGYPLHGSIRIQGSKNSSLPIVAASVLHRGVTVLHNCPKIIDVFCMIHILEEIGCQVMWKGSSLFIDATNLSSTIVSRQYAGTMRSSIVLLGALLGRAGEASISYPGGCVIGSRPIDLHLQALHAMGVEIKEKDGILNAKAKKLQGVVIEFPFPSVGATENAVLAAVFAEGTTRLMGCAKEPEITELCRFLNCMGAIIEGAGTDTIRIRGVKRLHDIEYEIVPDRIVAGTYVLAALGTRGVIVLENAPARQMDTMQSLAEKMGGICEWEGKRLFVDGRFAKEPVPFINTEPYPGFPTDLQSQLMAVLTKANGKSVIQENIFGARFKIAEQLRKMGADVSINGMEAVVYGNSRLKGANVEAMELRGGAALVIAALMSEGKSIITGTGFIERGYEDIVRDFKLLGGKISNSEEA